MKPPYRRVDIKALARQPATSLFAAACDDGLRFCDIKNIYVKRYVDVPVEGGLRSVDWHPKGNYFVTCNLGSSQRLTHGDAPPCIRLWKKDTELGSAHVIAEQPHERTIGTRTPFCPNGNLIAAATNDGQDLGVYRMPDVALLAAATKS